MDWVYYALLLLVMVTGIFLSILGLPGIWLMVLSVAIYAWLTAAAGFVGIKSLILLVGIAALSEVVEFVAGSAGAKKAGGSRRAMMGAVIGGLLGGIFLSVIPIPVISTIIGVCLGCFIGAATVEIAIGRQMGHSMRVGIGAARGRFWGIVWKLVFCVIILLISGVVAFPTGGSQTIQPPASAPSSQ